MRLALLAVGKMKDGPERDLQARYLDRARATGRSLGITSVEVIELTESRATRAPDRKADESRMILERAQNGILIALDERGESPTSEVFSRLVQRYLDQSEKSISFVIGGADGLADEVIAKASHVMAFGAMTWPHQLVRILLAEQIYRAMTVLSGHPYHRA